MHNTRSNLSGSLIPPSRSPEVVIEALECVSNKWQAHLGRFLRLTPRGRSLGLLCLEHCGVVGLIDLVCGEIGSVDSTRKTWLEGSANTAERVKFNATEEGVALDLVRAATTETVLGVDNEAVLSSQLLSTLRWNNL